MVAMYEIIQYRLDLGSYERLNTGSYRKTGNFDEWKL